MIRGKGGKRLGGSTLAQEKQASEEEEGGASGGAENTEGKEPTLSDLMAIFQAHMGQQDAREAKQNEVTARQEQRFKVLQHQFQLLQLEVQARTSVAPNPLSEDSDPPDREVQSSTMHLLPDPAEPMMITQTRASAGQSCSQHKPRLDKLTDSDDIEHFLITFERIAVACRWQKADWIFQLIPLLTGKARGAYVHMDIDDSLDYDQVKSAILAKYDINPETYRQRFRSLEVNPDESPKELYARLKELYGKWIQSKGKTIQEIGKVIILEQYLRMLSTELQVWVREHDPDSAMEAARLAEVFVAARKKGQPWSYNSWRTARDNRQPTHNPGTGMRERLERMSELAQSHMVEAQQQQKSWYDRSARQRSFNPGQKVLVLLPSDDNKLLAKWQGPFAVIKKLGPTTYQVATPGRPRSSRTLHINLLKEWVQRPEQKEVMLIRGVQEEEEVDEQYLPSVRVPGDHNLNHLSEEKQLQVREICSYEVFQENPGRTDIVELDIVVKEGASVRRLSYRIPERLLASLKKEKDLMLSLGIIESSRSEWCNPVVLVPKKDGSIRFCIDFRYLNSISQFDSYPTPRIDELLERLGIYGPGFYHRFIPQFSTRAALLTDMTGSRCPNQIQWTEEAVAAFQDIQQSLSKEPVLYSPNFDGDFILQTDASDRGLGAELLQGPPDDRHPVAYISRKMFPREVRYSTVEKEALAIKWALDSFRYYLLGGEFTLETDHKALQWMERMKDTNGRITRWYLALQPFRFIIQNIPGKVNVTADYLSRSTSESPEEGG
ncbi:hypothetical protein PO909_033505 [Leuciscus waleckii]